MPRGSTGTTSGSGGGSVTQGTSPWVIDGDVNLAKVGGVSVALGQTTMAASIPVTLASNSTDVKITLDSEAVVLGAGSASIGVLGANSGVDIGDVTINNVAGSEVFVRGGYTEQTGLSAGSLNADLVASTDVSSYKSWSLQILGNLSGTITFQGSNDNSNWISIQAANLGYSTSDQLLSTNAAGNSIYSGTVGFRYLRCRITTYTSGTATGVLELYTWPNPNHYMGVGAAQYGTWTVQPGNTANTTAWLVTGSGTAGSAAAGVITVQGIASMTPVQVSQATASTLNMTEASAASILTSVQLIDDAIIADDAAFTPATTKVDMAGFFADETSTDSVDEGDGGAARMTLDRKQIITVQPHTAGGLSVFNGTSSDGGTALTNSAQAIKASAGQVYGWYAYNPNSTAQFVQLYNTAAASVTVGTTNPLFMLTIPATSAANVNFVQGITFTNAGFSAAATSTAGGNGAPTTALDVVIFYA